MVDENAES